MPIKATMKLNLWERDASETSFHILMTGGKNSLPEKSLYVIVMYSTGEADFFMEH